MADSQSLVEARQERRKASKARLEKRRRERINQSFTELKNLLILSNPYKVCEKSAPYSSKRKAEMLEKLVIYLRSLQTEYYSEDNPLPIPTDSFNIGYRKCMTEVAQFLSTNKLDESPEFMARLFCHLNSRLREIGNNDNRDELEKDTEGDLTLISGIFETQSKTMTQTAQSLEHHDSSKTSELNPNSISAVQLPVKSTIIGPGFFSGGYYFWPVYNTNENIRDSYGHHSRTTNCIDNAENYSHLRIRIIQTQNQVATSSQRSAHGEHDSPEFLKQPLNNKMWRPWSQS